MVVDPHHAIKRMSQCPIERRSKSLGFCLQRSERRPHLEIARSAALDGDGKLPAFECRIAAGTPQYVAHFKVKLDITLKQIAAFGANATHHGVLSELKYAVARLLPGFPSPQPLADQGGREFIDQLGIDLVAILGANIGERRESLSEGRSQCRYPSGGRRSGGVGSRSVPVATCRLMASETAFARSQDSLDWRCLARMRLASGGGSAAFLRNNSSSSSRDIAGVGTAHPFDPMARLKV